MGEYAEGNNDSGYKATLSDLFHDQSNHKIEILDKRREQYVDWCTRMGLRN